MRRRFAVVVFALATTAAAGVSAGQPVSAGGWALTTLDEVPVPAVGEEIGVGFTILQHGQTPVWLEPSETVGLQITAPSGASTFFRAERDGEIGHYLATVVFSEAGTHTWTALQGWFGPQDLGPLGVEPAASNASGASSTPSVRAADDGSSAWLRYGLPAIALLLGAFVVFDTIRARRKPTVA